MVVGIVPSSNCSISSYNCQTMSKTLPGGIHLFFLLNSYSGWYYSC